jgi:hypothetical protein
MNVEFTIQDKAWNKVMNYARAAYEEFKSEIGGMMVVIEDKNGDWELKDPVIMKQRISASNTHLDQKELAAYYTKAAMKYKKVNFRFCWWHSHHTMGAFWSGTDTNTIDEFSDGDFSFALVVNLKEEYKFRVSVWKPIEVHEDVELDILTKEVNVPKKIEDEVNELCNKEVGYIGTHNSNNYSHLGYHNQSNLFDDNLNNPLYPKVTKEPIYSQVYRFIDKVHGNLIAGELTYGDYSRKVKEMNVDLDTQCTGIKIILLPEKKLEKQLMFSTPGEFIDETELDDALDADAWNSSFNVC